MGKFADAMGGVWTLVSTGAAVPIGYGLMAQGAAIVDGWLDAAMSLMYSLVNEASAQLALIEPNWYNKISGLNESLSTLLGAFRFVNYFFDIGTWAGLFASAFTLILFIRAIRWVLSFIPWINGG